MDSKIPLAKYGYIDPVTTSEKSDQIVENYRKNHQQIIQEDINYKSPLSLSVLPKRPRKRFFLPALDYLSVYAIAVNEENACGGRVVTAPTNGAAGTIPSVLKYYLEFISENPENDVMEFLLTTAAVGMLFKRGASISGKIGTFFYIL